LKPDVFQIYGASWRLAKSVEGLVWVCAQVATRASIATLASGLETLTRMPDGILFDTAVVGRQGGTGQTFDWNWISDARTAGELTQLGAIILAGGLTPENVADAIRIARPYAVDVSSGVEIAGKPGIKDPIKMRDFVQAVRGST
jgi:phosphoribosylanthranilate isomerase